MAMRVVATLVAIVLSTLGPTVTFAESELLEPIVTRHAGTLPLYVCKELIALGEEKGFTVEQESIDLYEENAKASQSIEVFERYDGITSPAIWAALEPWIPRLTELVKVSIDKATDRFYFPDKPDRTPQLGWVFFRKYSPTSKRESLKLHVDSNMHTLNIALNDDFEGGGVFYVRPPALQGKNADGRPDVPDEYMGYDWLSGVKRENTSDIVFPRLEGGDVLVHNFTVWHAVAPIEAGTRYSFVLFYDMDNPAIQDDFYHDFLAKPDRDEDALTVEFHNGMDRHIDLAFVYENEQGEEETDLFEENVPPFQRVGMHSHEGHVWHAFLHGTDTVVSKFVIREEQILYKIEEDNAPNNPSDEL